MPKDVFPCRYYPAVAPINDTEIAIISGYDSHYFKDVYLFNTEKKSVKRVVEDYDGSDGYYPNTN